MERLVETTATTLEAAVVAPVETVEAPRKWEVTLQVEVPRNFPTRTVLLVAGTALVAGGIGVYAGVHSKAREVDFLKSQVQSLKH